MLESKETVQSIKLSYRVLIFPRNTNPILITELKKQTNSKEASCEAGPEIKTNIRKCRWKPGSFRFSRSKVLKTQNAPR